MALASSILFIDTSLNCTSSYALSYPQPKQKWLIRKHLLSLLQDYPTFTPSSDKFIHNDGTAVNLLKATGNLHVSDHSPPIPLTIWLHENYPYMPPLIFVSPSTSPIHQHHPFVDLSGSTSVPYLQTWTFPRCNLTNLVHNLVKIFRHDHPYFSSSSSSFSHPSLVSKMEAIDRLAGMVHYDVLELKAKSGEEVGELSELHGELRKREMVIRCFMSDLERERLGLEERVMGLREEGELVMKWVNLNGVEEGFLMEDDDGFEGEDEESKMVIECVAGDRGIEDLMYGMEKGLEGGVMSFEEYIKQVRILSREQFIHRAMLVKLRGPHSLSFLHSCI
ncbi:Ubiquitin-conjugating enzyme/RWD-like protein [Euphorbia peplus]|nr:Ubiquitin-conjugating enzyme/RWD-like protein [Euphorbia peplus]